MAGGIDLAALKTEIIVNIDKFKSDMEKAKTIGTEEADKISKALSGTAKVGQELTKLGTTLMKTVTLPIVGVGVATSKMAVDFESSFAKVSTLLDSNIVDFDDYQEELLEGSNASKIAVEDYSEAVYQSISAGVDQKKAIGFTTEAMKLAKGGFTTGASAVDLLTTALNGYNLETDEATRISDMLITTQNEGKTTVDELAGSMGKVIKLADTSGFAMDELSTSYALLTKNGIATAEAGTYIKSMLNELTTSGSKTDKTLRELTGKGFAELKNEGVATTDILSMLEEEANKNGQTLKDMFGSVEAGSAALVLGAESGEEYNQILGKMQESAGATAEAFSKIDNTSAEKLAGSMNELKNAGIKLGQLFVPIVGEVANKISELVGRFEELDDGQRENLIRWAAIAAAAGPVLALFGGGITTVVKLSTAFSGVSAAIGATGGAAGVIGGLTSLSAVAAPAALILAGVGVGMYALHENTELMNGTILRTVEEMSWMERALADFHGIEVKTKDELVAMGLVHKDFSENISPEFRKAVEDSEKKLRELEFSMNEINFDGIVTSAETAALKIKVEEMCNGAVQTIESKKEESQKSMSEMFMVDDGKINESEQTVLNFLNRNYDNNIIKVEQLKSDILTSWNAYIEEKGYLNDDEIRQVQAKLDEISRIELESVGSNQDEILFAKHEFLARVKTLDLDSATELLQEKALKRDEEIVQIEASHNSQLEQLKSLYAEANPMVRRNLDEQIKSHTDTRDKKIQAEKDLYESYIKIINEKNPELLSKINEYNNKQFSQNDEKKRNILKTITSEYAEMNQITESGLYTMYNHIKERNGEVVVNYDKTTGKVIGAWDKTHNTVGGYSEQIANDTAMMAQKYTESMVLIDDSQQIYIDQSGNVKSHTGEVTGTMASLTETTDGTRLKFIDLNGTPVEIKSDAPIRKGEMIQLQESIDAIDKDVRITITTHHVNTYSNGGSVPYSPQYNGLDNVPYDGFRARLHKGERVLTAQENKDYTEAPKAGNVEINFYNPVETPSEHARRIRNMLVDLGREF